MHPGRTLEYKGTKKVETVVQSVDATTHSYTIQPIISCDGEFLSPLLIVLQEVKGMFGPIIKKNLFTSPNVSAYPSKSGKVTKEILISWFKEIYFPNVSGNSVLIVDSWRTYNDKEAIGSVKPANKEYEMLIIPPKTTSQIQPLDVFFFRTWKNFVRKISDRVELDELPVNLFERNNILKLQSLVHYQFSALRYKNFIIYSWFKSGFLKERPNRFLTPVEYCFDLKEEDCFELNSQCSKGPFIRCSWCEQVLCLTHLFINYHYCSI